MLEVADLVPDEFRHTFQAATWRDPSGVDWSVEIAPMLVNHRVLMDPAGFPWVYGTYGWCYPNLTSAVLAVRVWDPLVQDEPVGWHKRAGALRRALMRPPNAPVRCEHGAYENCRVVGCEHWHRDVPE